MPSSSRTSACRAGWHNLYRYNRKYFDDRGAALAVEEETEALRNAYRLESLVTPSVWPPPQSALSLFSTAELSDAAQWACDALSIVHGGTSDAAWDIWRATGTLAAAGSAVVERDDLDENASESPSDVDVEEEEPTQTGTTNPLSAPISSQADAPPPASDSNSDSDEPAPPPTERRKPPAKADPDDIFSLSWNSLLASCKPDRNHSQPHLSPRTPTPPPPPPHRKSRILRRHTKRWSTPVTPLVPRKPRISFAEEVDYRAIAARGQDQEEDVPTDVSEDEEEGAGASATKRDRGDDASASLESEEEEEGLDEPAEATRVVKAEPEPDADEIVVPPRPKPPTCASDSHEDSDDAVCSQSAGTKPTFRSFNDAKACPAATSKVDPERHERASTSTPRPVGPTTFKGDASHPYLDLRKINTPPKRASKPAFAPSPAAGSSQSNKPLNRRTHRASAVASVSTNKFP